LQQQQQQQQQAPVPLPTHTLARPSVSLLPACPCCLARLQLVMVAAWMEMTSSEERSSVHSYWRLAGIHGKKWSYNDVDAPAECVGGLCTGLTVAAAVRRWRHTSHLLHTPWHAV
jgi:hypothetical protein